MDISDTLEAIARGMADYLQQLGELVGSIKGQQAAAEGNRAKIKQANEQGGKVLQLVKKSQGSDISKKENALEILLNIPGLSVDNKPRKDGRWQGRISIEGTQRSIYGKSREEVISKLQGIVSGEIKLNNAGKKRTKKSYTFHSWLDKWLELYKLPKLKAASAENLKYYIARLKTLFEDKHLRSLDGLSIQERLLSVDGTRMRKLLLLYLNSALNVAVKLKFLPSNPCEAVELPQHKASKKRALTVAEQQLFIEAIRDNKHEALFYLMLSTGIRIGEALALTGADITPDGVSISKNAVFINRQKVIQNTPKSEAGNRIVPLPDAARKLIGDTAAVEGLLFDCSYNAAKLAIGKVFDKLGIDGCGLHALRHTYATRLEEAGISAKLRQYLLGHATVQMTQNIYTEVQPTYVQQNASALKGIFDTKNTLDADKKAPKQ